MTKKTNGFTIPIIYSNQDFDEIQNRACEINAADKAAGLPHSEYGYSASAIERARAQYKEAQAAYYSG